MWIILNVIYGLVMISVVNNQNPTIMNAGIGFLDGFALFMAGLILFKFFFATIY
jgi:hypothetical protein